MSERSNHRNQPRDQPLADSRLTFQYAALGNLRCSPGAWRAWLESGSLETLELGTLDIPALLIAGERDPVISLYLLRSEIAPHLTEPRLEAAGRVAALTAEFAGEYWLIRSQNPARSWAVRRYARAKIATVNAVIGAPVFERVKVS